MGTFSSKSLLVKFFVTVLMIVGVNSKTLHRVGGGRYTWNPNVNFSDWATNERFYSGEWLYFGFNPTSHNVLEVNKSSYEQCIDTDFISNVTRGGRDVFQLLQPKPYYFICGRGYCNQGMKLAVNVLPQPPAHSTSTATSLISSTALAAMAILTLAFQVLM